MVINVGGLWDKPIPVAEEMPSTPFIYSDIVCAETLQGYNIEAYQSYEDAIYFKNTSPLTNFESDPDQYNFRSCIDIIKEICPKEQPEIRCPGRSKDNRYVLSTESDQCDKYNKRSEKILCDGTSKELRVRSSSPKDRHSRVNTAKGLRDTRVRLSLPTAVKFYDVHYRLGVDRPSKTLDWLINKAQAAIDELSQAHEPLHHISKMHTSTDLHTVSSSKDGCSNITRSVADVKRKSVRIGRVAKEPTVRSCSFIKAGVPQVFADPKDICVPSSSTPPAIDCLMPESPQRVQP